MKYTIMIYNTIIILHSVMENNVHINQHTQKAKKKKNDKGIIL